MVEDKPTRSRFGRIRGVGDSVSDAVQAVTGRSADALETVTGKSTVEAITEFTDAYTEVLTGLDADVQSMRREIGEVRKQVVHVVEESAEIRAELVQHRRTTRMAVIAAGIAVVAGIVAIALAVSM